jgi:DNA repair protein RecN (Recombination protein N)
MVGELGRLLVDLHGQHEHQTLMRPDEQRTILDARAGAVDLAERVAETHARLRDATARIEDLDRRRAEVEARAEFLRFQAEEIERVKLVEGEEETLEADAARLDHAEDLARLSDSLYQALYAAGDAVTARLDAIRRTLDQLIRIDPSQADARTQIDEAFYTLDELGRRMGDYASSIEHDPSRLDDIRRRQDAIFRLKAKYGPELADVIAAGARAREELDLLDRASFERKEGEKAVEKARTELDRAASALTRARRKGAKELLADVATLLPDLGMPAARFDVVLTAVDPPRARGAEDVEFRIAVNAGFEPRSLARVASGGELSRVMLALKAALARYDAVPTLVFDEVDVGIGGRAAHGVAAKLHEVARTHQVFVVTHLPQIASRADQHLYVEKEERAGTTVTMLHVLRGEDRVRELARLLGGDPESALSLEHAREMLGAAAG